MSSDEAKQREIGKLYARSKKHFPEVPELTVGELEELRRRQRVVLVDVREPREQAVSRIPGAVTAKQFEAEPAEYQGATIVTYCTIGHRSGLYAKRLRADGWDAYNLEGAILAWTHAGGELENDAGTTRRVHVYGERWSLAADGYEPVW